MRHMEHGSYIGHWYDKLHDFKLAAAKTFVAEENMTTFAKAIDQFELVHLDISIAWMEVIQGRSLKSASKGFIRTMSALSDLPEAIALFWSSDSDKQKML